MGDRVRATKVEKATAAAIVRANSENSRPTSPCRKAMGTNTATSTTEVATTAKPTCRVPRKAATRRVSPYCSMRRCTFSSTTMASSTTSPMASTRASRVRMLMEKPRASSTVKVAMMETGTVTAGTSMARTDPRNRKITRITRAMAIA